MTLPQNIVIVEDEVITQRYLQDIFGQFDVTVTGCFDNASDTIQALKKIECDLLLVDINIKGPMDGIQMVRQILRDSNFPIVFITAHNDDETLEEILELAPYGFIGKPFSSKEIIITLQIAYKRYLTHINLETTTNKKNTDNIMINKRYMFSHKQRTLYEDGLHVKLNQKQTLLIQILVENIDHAVESEMLVDKIWEQNIIADSALRTLVYSLRKKLPDLPIVSHSKMGYVLQKDKE